MKQPSKHRQAILIFSVGIPILIAAVAFGAVLFGRAKLTSIYNTKQDAYDKYLYAASATRELEAELSVEGRKEKIAYWNEKLSQDFVPTLSSKIDGILENYDEEVLRQTSMSKLPGDSAIAKSKRDTYELVSLGFEGGFKPMQVLLAKLEEEMPQLVLEKLSVTPLTNDKSATEGTAKLSFNVTYLSWKKKTPDTPES